VLPRIRWHSLRTKIVAWSFIPATIVLSTVALVAFYAYQQVTEDLVIQRNRELARLTASQLATELDEYSRSLSALARTADLASHDPATQGAALAQAENLLAVYDGGLLILDEHGLVVAAVPERPDAVGQDWSDRAYFRQMVRAPDSVLSDVLTDGPRGAPVILMAVPITGGEGETLGAVAGMFRLGASAVSSFYGSIVKLRLGGDGNAYLVDSLGNLIYHTDTRRIGENVAADPIVTRALRGQVEAFRTRSAAGSQIVASFAPVPGTTWALVSETGWETLLRPSRRYSRFLLALLALGVILPALVVAVGVRRITQPISDLILAARHVAAGNLGHTVDANTGDEVEELVTQFNLMSTELRESYTALREREERLELVLRATNDGIWDWNLRTDECYFSQRWKSMLGYADDEIPNRVGEWRRLMHPDDVAHAEATVAAYIQGQEPEYRIEHRLLHKDGSYRWILSRGVALRDAGGRPYRLVGSHTDITERKKADQALQERLDFERIIASISTQFVNLAPEEIDNGIQRALRAMGEFADVDHTCVFMYTDNMTRMSCSHEWCAPGVAPRIARLQALPLSSLPWLVKKIENLEVIHIPRMDDLPPEAVAERDLFDRQGVNSMIGIPMAYRGQAAGFLGLSATRSERAWSQQTIALFSIVGEIFVNALEHKRAGEALRSAYQMLERRVDERTHELSTLLEVSNNVASMLKLDPLLGLVLDSLREVIPFSGASIMTLEESQLKMAAYRGPLTQQQALQLRFSLTQFQVNHEVIRRKAPVVIADTQGLDRDAALFRESAGDELFTTYAYIRSWIGAPLVVKDRVIGMLTLDHSEAAYYTQRHAEIAMAFANQVAVAIENARLFEAEERRVEQFRVISEVGQRITTILSVDELLWQVSRVIKETLHYYLVGIALIEGDELAFRAGAGAVWEDPTFDPPRLQVGKEGITGWVAATGDPLLVPDISQEPRYYGLTLSSEIRSEIAVPLKVKDAVIGVLHAQSDRLEAFDASDLTVLQSLAQQAAIAIENARLYEQAQQVATLEERQRLARELHDSVTQSLYALTLYGEAAGRTLASGDHQRAAEHLTVMRDTAQEALREMRLLIFELRPVALEQEGLAAALRARLEAVEGRAGLHIQMDASGDLALPMPLQTELYRIAQETLNNTLKHAKAQSVRLNLARDGALVTLEVVDDGIGFDLQAPRRGLGLKGIAERARLLNGSMELNSQPGQGTRIRVTIPLAG